MGMGETDEVEKSAGIEQKLSQLRGDARAWEMSCGSRQAGGRASGRMFKRNWQTMGAKSEVESGSDVEEKREQDYEESKAGTRVKIKA